MLNFKFEARNHVRTTLNKRVQVLMKGLATDHKNMVGKMLFQLISKSPQWSGTYAYNWYAYVDDGTGTPFEDDPFGARDAINWTGEQQAQDSDDFIDFSEIRHMGMGESGGAITKADVASNNYVENLGDFYKLYRDGKGFTAKFQTIIIDNITDYRSNVENDKDDDGSPYIRKINKVNGKIFTMADVVRNYRSYRDLRWGIRGDGL